MGEIAIAKVISHATPLEVISSLLRTPSIVARSHQAVLVWLQKKPFDLRRHRIRLQSEESSLEISCRRLIRTQT